MDASVLYSKQVEYLQETKRTLEEKVMGLEQKKEHVSTEVANLSQKNRELCEELTHIDSLAKRLEMDKDRVLESADTELQGAKVSVSTSQRVRDLQTKESFSWICFFSFQQKELQRQQKIIEDLEDIVTRARRVCRILIFPDKRSLASSASLTSGSAWIGSITGTV